MGNLSISTGAGGAKEAFEAAKAEKSKHDICSPEVDKAVRDAALRAAQADGQITSDEAKLLTTLESDPESISTAQELNNTVVLETVDANKGSAQPSIPLVEDEGSTGEAKATAPKPVRPAANPQEAAFRQELKTTSGYLSPSSSKLSKHLKNYSDFLKAHEDLRGKIVSEAQNPHRASDFLDVLDKVDKGQTLNSDDIENVQKFLFYDTKAGEILPYEGDDNGVDGKFGYRSFTAMHRFFNELAGFPPNV